MESKVPPNLSFVTNSEIWLYFINLRSNNNTEQQIVSVIEKSFSKMVQWSMHWKRTV